MDRKKIFFSRGSILGDIIGSLPGLTFLHKKYNNPYIYFPVAQKCKQIVPFLQNHPLISDIKLTDGEESLGEIDQEIIKNCDLSFNIFPHHSDIYWYNNHGFLEDIFLLSGLTKEDYESLTPEEKLPKLYIDFPIERQNKTIAFLGFAGYGGDNPRSPNKNKWENILSRFPDYKFLHIGSEKDPLLNIDNYLNITNLSLFEQFSIALGCDAAIGTDSGSSWILNAYSLIPCLNFITMWQINHYENPLALAPEGKLVSTYFEKNGFGNMDLEEAYYTLEEFLNNI